MTILSKTQIDRSWNDGVLSVENAVTPEQLSVMQEQFAAWVGASRGHDAAYVETIDGRPRFDIELGSHRGPLHSLWHDDVFTGAVNQTEAARMQAAAVKCFAAAGSVCLMHSCIAHGSAPNLSDRPRTLFITVYSAADAFSCTPNPVPNKHKGLIDHGVDPEIIRATEYRLRPPEFPGGASFFVQQVRDRGAVTQ